MHRKSLKKTLLLALCWPIAAPCVAQIPPEVQTAFKQWAATSLHRIDAGTLDAPTSDLQPIRSMIGDARIVALSEGTHAGTEPLVFRNRLFRYLVEELRFSAIVLESGIVESRVLNDYVAGAPGEFDLVMKQGFSAGFDTFRQNRELVRWVRTYNAELPSGATKLKIFGMDVPGSAGNLDAARGPATSIEATLDYLRKVDPGAATSFQARLAKGVLAISKTNDYGALSQLDRDAFTSAIADMISLVQLRRLEYIAKSSEDEYEWAERGALSARNVDDWFRKMPVGWTLKDGFAWVPAAIAVRDHAMADNLEWILDRLAPDSRVLVFAATPHIATMPLKESMTHGHEIVPFGVYAKKRFGADFIAIYNPVMNGELLYCSVRPRRKMPLQAPPSTSLEALFGSVGESRYLIDLRTAPPVVSTWLEDYQDYWNGFGMSRLAAARSFDIAYFVTPITSDCIPE